MAAKDKLVYFDIYARGEPIRMLYALASQELEDVRISFEEWPAIKPDQPLEQLPVLHTTEGEVLCQTCTIGRYVARKFGFIGTNQWEETLHDLVIESTYDILTDTANKIYGWKVYTQLEPENKEKVVAEVRDNLLKKLPYIQSIAEKRGKRFIVGDTIGLAEVWFYTGLDFLTLAFPDAKEMTPWIKEFMLKMEADERIKSYLAMRPASSNGI